MVVLFVHGMGRTSVSGWFMLRRLRRAGYRTATFGYSAGRESFAQIANRLSARMQALLLDGDVALIGHSLGGLLLRQALASLPAPGRQPVHLYLLGSPVKSPRLAARLRTRWLYRIATTDCGQLLASPHRMSSVPVPTVAATGIAGTEGLRASRWAFGNEANDGVVTRSEVSAPWLADQVLVPVVHTWLPSSRLVTAILLQRLRQHRT